MQKFSLFPKKEWLHSQKPTPLIFLKSTEHLKKKKKRKYQTRAKKYKKITKPKSFCFNAEQGTTLRLFTKLNQPQHATGVTV